jgi:hypothetical protein
MKNEKRKWIKCSASKPMLHERVKLRFEKGDVAIGWRVSDTAYNVLSYLRGFGLVPQWKQIEVKRP